jgi:hypothetical protein
MRRLLAALLLLAWSTAAFPITHGNFDQPDRPDGGHALDSRPLADGAETGEETGATAISVAHCGEGNTGFAKVTSCAGAVWSFAFGSAERAIATFAGVIALSTVLLWINARRTAKAARVAAEQIPAAERAYLFVTPTNILLDDTRTETTVHLRVDNAGRTPGILTMVYGQFSKKPPKGDTPVYEGGGSKEFELVINSSNGMNPHDPASAVILPVTFKIDYAEPIHFWGYVEYLDILKRQHTSRFCTLIYPVQGKWEIAGSRAWNDWT